MWNPCYLTTILSSRFVFKNLLRGKLYGEENIPKTGPFIVAPNHLSHFDPPLIGGAFRSRELMFMARKSLFKAGFLNFLLSRLNVIPVDKEHQGDIRAIRQALAALKRGLGLVIFPEGTRSLDGQLGKAQAGLGFLACQSRAPVIPVRITGTFEILKKNTVWPDICHTPSITIGPPMPYETYHLFEKDYQRTADYLFEHVRQI
ncbi:MAG: 1-acyl-sn-glycerol-3-phosphate acyltransferase [Verrucomicrobiota bacterium]|nr:MAG: 1-acyl-sn-glycerol-3-phosphate acyltransferase [Verrucomicrobiota bacterium]